MRAGIATGCLIVCQIAHLIIRLLCVR